MTTNVTIQCELPGLQAEAICELIAAVFTHEQRELEPINVVFINDETMATMNWDFLQHEGPTDVIAFPNEPDEFSPPNIPMELGDVYVSVETAARECVKYDRDALTEVYVYVVHGLLHLLGYDDATTEERTAMLARGDRIVDGFLSVSD